MGQGKTVHGIYIPSTITGPGKLQFSAMFGTLFFTLLFKIKERLAGMMLPDRPAVRQKRYTLIIKDQEIPWSFVQRIRRICGGDWDQTLDIFWKARNATGNNGIIKYISKGLVDLAKGNRWLLMPSRERENGRMEVVRQWWSSLYQRKPKEGTTSCREALKDALLTILDKMK